MDDVAHQFTTTSQTTTTKTVTEEKDMKPVVNESKLAIVLSAASLAASLVAVSVSVLVLALQFKRGNSKSKPKSGKKELPKMEEFTTRVSTFHTYSSPIYNPYFSEEKGDDIK